MKTFNQVVGTLVLALVMTGCSSLSVLQAVVDATAAAVPILQAENVPVPPQVPVYLAAVSDCIGGQTGNPTTAQLAEISACFAKQVAPALPTGVSRAVVNIVALVVQDVAKYLEKNPAPVAAKGPTVNRPIPLSAGDAAKVETMRGKAKQTTAAIKAIKTAK
jgi:hypothetical protein